MSTSGKSVKRKCVVVKRTKVVKGKRKSVKVRKCRTAPAKPPLALKARRYSTKKLPDVAPPVPMPPPGIPAPVASIESPIRKYDGTFGKEQAERLAWRAGFGPRPGQLDELVQLGLDQAVQTFTRPQGQAPMDGPEPTLFDKPIDPGSTFGSFAYWLDRMVRSRHQLIERLALVFHDWFATQRDGVMSDLQMLEQINVFRANGLADFRSMLRAVTTNPAMLLFLNGQQNRRGAVNENYGRELMELFTLGADRGAYTETDVREIARALTGWHGDPNGAAPYINWRFDALVWDDATKTIFGKSGRFNWEDACELVLTHPLHPSFFIAKLWSYFIPEPPSAPLRAALEALYVSSGYQIQPIVEAILTCPEFYEGPQMVKPPMVLIAGLHRAQAIGVKYNDFWDLSLMANQRVYEPPNVSGWDDSRWLDSNTTIARWLAVASSLIDTRLSTAAGYPEQTAEEALAGVRAVWADPTLTDQTLQVLLEFSRSMVPAQGSKAALELARMQRWNALLQLVAGCPDYQTC